MPAFTESDLARDWQDHGNAIFVASLSNGQIAYQDGDLSVSWRDLGRYTQESRLQVVSLRLKFRTEWFCGVPDSPPAYYLSKGFGGIVGGPSTPFISLGYLQGDRFRVVQVSVPLFEILTMADREIDKDDPRIIWNGRDT